MSNDAEPTPYERRWRMLPVVLAAMFMAQFDLFVVNVAAATLERRLHTSAATLELVIGGYAFVYAAGLVTGGRLGDLFGQRRLFLAGTSGFVVASALCGLAQTPGELVAARLVQGLTAAAMVPQVLALITAVFPAAERPRALAWFGVTMGVGAVAGQVLGGLLLTADVAGLSWRAIFLVNVPVGLVAVAAAARLVPATPRAGRPRLDPLGAVGLSGSLGLALVPLVIGREEGWPVWSWLCLAASVPALVATLAWERRLGRRGGQPLLDLGLFADRAFSRGLVVNVGAFAGFHSFLFCQTLVLQTGLGLSAEKAGLVFAPLGVAFAVASVGARRLMPRYGPRVITAGSTVAAAGLLVVLLVVTVRGGDLRAVDLLGPMVLVGLGNGLAVPALVGAVLSGVRPAYAGVASGVLTTAQQFASAAGIAALGGLFLSALGHGSGAAAYGGALRWELVPSLLLALLAAAGSLLLPAPPRPEPAAVAADEPYASRSSAATPT